MNALPTTATTLRAWRCPEHGIDYGDVPGSLRLSWECSQCRKLADQAQQALRAERIRYQWWRDQSGIPARYRAATPETIQPVSKSAKALARAVSAYTADLHARLDAGDGMLLIGPPGLGKSLALCAVVNAACAAFRGPIYRAWPEVVAEVKAGFSAEKDDPRRLAVDRLLDAPLLALDELGVCGLTDWSHGELFRLVDHRYSQRLPTLVAANATAANLPELVGERIADRLRETGPQLVLSGESQRGKLSIAGTDALPAPPASVTCRLHEHGEWREREIGKEREW